MESSQSSLNEYSEESGWTVYFEDFFASQKSIKVSDDDFTGYGDHESIVSGTSSISDAASCVRQNAKKDSSSTGNRKFSKGRNYEGRRPISYDESLEDTATSPDTSSKDNKCLSCKNKEEPSKDGIDRSS